jgi:hypothetical protein
MKIYIDGVAQPLTIPAPFCGTTAGTAVNIAACSWLTASSNDPLTIGSYNGQAEFFSGLIDDVRIYNRALSAAEVGDVVSLAGWWPLDENTGSKTVDRTGNAATAGTYPQANLTGTAWTAGESGSALSFNGTTSSVSSGNQWSTNFGSRSFSVATWFKSTASGWQRMVSKGNYGNTPGYLLQYNSGAVSFGLGATDSAAAHAAMATTATSYADGAWHHAVAVVDRTANTVKIYVDGVAQQLVAAAPYCGSATGSTLSISGCGLLDATTASPLTFGSYNGTTEFFQGALDDIRVYQKALSAAEVAALAS